jgi:hypothetical protein
MSAAAAFVIPPAVLDQFKALKLRRAHKYLILVADSDSMELSVEKAGAPTATADQLFANLPSSDCRSVCAFLMN